MNTAKEIADYILTLTDDEAGDLISHLKLQKLLYYSQGFALVFLGRPLFNEKIVSWQHGPVVPSVWEQFKDYGSNPIPKNEDFDLSIIDLETKNIIDEVYSVYGQFSAWKLRNMTHEESPWKSVAIGDIITHGSLREFFETLTVS